MASFIIQTHRTQISNCFAAHRQAASTRAPNFLPDAATRVEVVQNGLPQPDPASGGKTVAETFKALRPGGVSIVLGVGPEPIEVSAMDLIFGNRKLEGTLTGNPRDR